MKERPILFSAPMVRAILEGRKGQTRRIVKPQPAAEPMPVYGQIDARLAALAPEMRCPYGQPGDRLWVRETWADTRTGGFDRPVHYAADTKPGSEADDIRKAFGVKWRPSIHTPRWASRLTLEVTGVRVERLQDITANDILAEGVVDPEMSIIAGVGVHHPDRLRAEWRKLWGSINGAGSWDLNPWVWVVEFRRVA